MKKYFFMSVLAVFAFIACSSEKSTQQDKPSEANASQKISNTNMSFKLIEMKDNGDSYELTHSLGVAKVVKNPSKVIIFDLGTLDTFDALGLNDKVVGVTAKTLPAYLEQFKSKTSVGSVNELDFEKISELAPELIIISGRQAKFFDKLNQIAPTIFVGTDNQNFFPSFENKTLAIAKLFSKEEEAKKQIQDIQNELKAVQAKIDKDKKALIVLTNTNRISAFGEGSRFGLIHDLIGVPAADTSIKVGTHGNSVNSEYILKINPDYIFVVDRNVIVKNQEKAQNILNNQIVAKTKAAQNNKIIYLDPEYWYLSGGGLESLKAMIKEVADSL